MHRAVLCRAYRLGIGEHCKDTIYIYLYAHQSYSLFVFFLTAPAGLWCPAELHWVTYEVTLHPFVMRWHKNEAFRHWSGYLLKSCTVYACPSSLKMANSLWTYTMCTESTSCQRAPRAWPCFVLTQVFFLPLDGIAIGEVFIQWPFQWLLDNLCALSTIIYHNFIHFTSK